jgi:group I intron endonuclease
MIKIEPNNPGFTGESINKFMLIYKATNTINQKSYVGKTENTFDKRKSDHLTDAKQDKGFAFHSAIRKYGEENFVWEIVEDNITDDAVLNQKEEYYISLYESFGPKGYNMTKGGEGQKGWVPSEETRAKWSEQRKGKDPWNKGTAKPKKVLTEEEKSARKADADRRRSETLKGIKTWNTGLKDVYGRTTYKVTYKDGTEKIGTRVDLGLPGYVVNYMFKDKCGSRKYNIKSIERVGGAIDDKDRTI